MMISMQLFFPLFLQDGSFQVFQHVLYIRCLVEPFGHQSSALSLSLSLSLSPSPPPPLSLSLSLFLLVFFDSLCPASVVVSNWAGILQDMVGHGFAPSAVSLSVVELPLVYPVGSQMFGGVLPCLH